MKILPFLLGLTVSSASFGYEAMIKKRELAPELDALLAKASAETGVVFNPSDFMKIESRDLATSRFTMFVQTNSMIPVAQTAVRIWSDLRTNELILAEMHLDEKAQKQKALLANKYLRAKFSSSAIKSRSLEEVINKMASKEISTHSTDSRVLGIKFKDQWENGDLVRVMEIRGRRGVHLLKISLLRNKVINKDYWEFPQSESLTLKAHVYPIYEEVEGTGEKLPYELKELRYIDAKVYEAGNDPLGGLGNLRFTEDKYYPLLAGTAQGETLGLWSEQSIRAKVEKLTASLPLRENSFHNGLLLSGKYATINLHPAAKDAFKDITFDLKPTTNHLLNWFNKGSGWEARPVSGFAGKPITSESDLLNRIPFRHPLHDATTYINQGFDEIQVYYAVTTLMESLVNMGFTDKELSEKPFHAFLYDPDIGMRDNAYYYDNTINFTTYSKESLNYARDNSTIWHELGHAIMERLMGSHLGFANTKGGYGGLSEGMADFVASIVTEDLTDGVEFPGKNNFRIINETGFYLTNEFHDEGEAYGGAMNDMLLTIISYEGRYGLKAFTDLTLEAMRLTRNHPSLSAASWFEHMLYADEIGSSLRAPGKYKNIILDTLSARNFSFEKSFKPAEMKITFADSELTHDSPASREKPLSSCGENGKVSYDLKLSLKEGDAHFIQFPATVKVEYKKGALQGAIKWDGEVNNPEVYTISGADETLTLPIRASLECDFVNQPDGSCKDYAYIQIFNQGSAKPIAKKRFYLRLNEASCSR
jgi:hypothetical protein